MTPTQKPRARGDELDANTEHVHPILAEQQENVHEKIRAGAERAEDELAVELRLEGLQALAQTDQVKATELLVHAHEGLPDRILHNKLCAMCTKRQNE